MPSICRLSTYQHIQAPGLHLTAATVLCRDSRSPSSRLEASRESHNQKERNRRKDISDAVDDMRQIVPNCNAKTDKVSTYSLYHHRHYRLCWVVWRRL